MSLSVPASTKFRYEGNGVTSIFAYYARVFSGNDIIVQILDRATDEVIENLVFNVDYTVSIQNDGTAEITVTALNVPSNSQDILITRAVAKTQPEVLPAGTTFPSQTVERGLDRVTVLMQDIGEQVDRAIKLPITSQITSIESPLPLANALIGWNNAADALENKVPADLSLATVTSFASSLLNDSTAAEARATLGAMSAEVPSFKNALINGDMSVAQRGTSFAAIASLTRTLDGWFAWNSGGGISQRVSQVTGIGLQGFQFALQNGRTSGNSNTGTLRLGQIVETRDCYRFAGKSCFLSFWARAGANFSASGNTLTVRSQQGTGADQGASALIGATWTSQTVAATSNVTLISGWARYSVPVSFISTTTELSVEFFYTPTGTAGAADHFEITGVQLEVDALTGYDYTPHQITLQRCKRLLPSYIGTNTTTAGVGVGQAYNTSNVVISVPLIPQARVAPTGITVSSVGHFSLYNSAGAGAAASSIVYTGASTDTVTIEATRTGAGLNAGNASIFYSTNASAQILFTGAEL